MSEIVCENGSVVRIADRDEELFAFDQQIDRLRRELQAVESRRASVLALRTYREVTEWLKTKSEPIQSQAI